MVAVRSLIIYPSFVREFCRYRLVIGVRSRSRLAPSRERLWSAIELSAGSTSLHHVGFR